MSSNYSGIGKATGLAAAVAVAMSANAQIAPSPAPTTELQEIVVTGSYIPRTDSETPSPVTIITSARC